MRLTFFRVLNGSLSENLELIYSCPYIFLSNGVLKNSWWSVKDMIERDDDYRIIDNIHKECDISKKELNLVEELLFTDDKDNWIIATQIWRKYVKIKEKDEVCALL